jgi:magnesium-transporting ATPase (P-type)
MFSSGFNGFPPFFLGAFLLPSRKAAAAQPVQGWIYMILIAVTLAVAAIPEGIPLCVTISLAIGCQEMVAKNVQAGLLATSVDLPWL